MGCAMNENSELRALKIKERWYDQIVEWLRFAHPEVHEDYMKRVMAVNKIENAPTAIGPPPGIIMHGPPGEGTKMFLEMRSADPEAIDKAIMEGKSHESD